ncbi:glycosyltransferase family 4 protein [Brevibacillus borstelensis]|uniref:glycosyltransferase family 4 protein n=1 Tax=Brevibacillus borstelensis TaxID=45462 RepID=UPI0030BE3584
MKIAIATVQVPFVRGGAEFLAENLKQQLWKRGYEAEIVTIPVKRKPPRSLFNSIKMTRYVNLTETIGSKIDMLICLKFPMYYVQHDNKVLWLLHQQREVYDLWGTPYSDVHQMEYGQQLRDLIMKYDNKYIPEHKKLLTISSTISERLKKYNGIDSTPLYHPPAFYEQLHFESVDDYIFCIGRLDPLKRQDLLVEALRYTKTPVRVLLAGKGDETYAKRLRALAEAYSLQDKVRFLGWINDQEKISYYANALAVYYGPFQEDYGYVTLEAIYSGKPVITHFDSGCPLEFVADGNNGFVVDMQPEAIAEKMDWLYENKQAAKSMGMDGKRQLERYDMDWDHVIQTLITN